MQCSDAPDAPDGDGILIDTTAGGPAGLFATHVAAATGENAHADDAHADDAHADDAHAGLLATHVADDAHADDAKADDLDLDAEDPTDKDGDGNGTASMPVNGTQSKPVRTSPITAKDRAVHDHVSAQTDRRYSELPTTSSDSKKEIATCVTDWLMDHPRGLGNGKGGEGLTFFNWLKDTHYRVCSKNKVCRCCMTKKDKKAENENSCEFCTWRPRRVCLSGKEVSYNIGPDKTEQSDYDYRKFCAIPGINGKMVRWEDDDHNDDN